MQNIHTKKYRSRIRDLTAEKNDKVCFPGEVPVKKDYLNFVIKYCVLALWVILYILRLKSNEEKESIYKNCKQLFFGWQPSNNARTHFIF